MFVQRLVTLNPVCIRQLFAVPGARFTQVDCLWMCDLWLHVAIQQFFVLGHDNKYIVSGVPGIFCGGIAGQNAFLRGQKSNNLPKMADLCYFSSLQWGGGGWQMPYAPIDAATRYYRERGNCTVLQVLKTWLGVLDDVKYSICQRDYQWLPRVKKNLQTLQK